MFRRVLITASTFSAIAVGTLLVSPVPAHADAWDRYWRELDDARDDYWRHMRRQARRDQRQWRRYWDDYEDRWDDDWHRGRTYNYRPHGYGRYYYGGSPVYSHWR